MITQAKVAKYIQGHRINGKDLTERHGTLITYKKIAVILRQYNQVTVISGQQWQSVLYVQELLVILFLSIVKLFLQNQEDGGFLKSRQLCHFSNAFFLVGKPAKEQKLPSQGAQVPYCGLQLRHLVLDNGY
jgi:hypothetical protein